MNTPFSISEALSAGWQRTKAHSGLLFQAMLILFALEVAVAIVGQVLRGSFLGIGAIIVLVILELFVGTGLTRIALMIGKGESAVIKDLFPNWRVVLRFYCASILAGIIIVLPAIAGLIIASVVGLGSIMMAMGPQSMGSVGVTFVISIIIFIAGVVATVYFALRYSMVRFAVLDGAGITGSIRTSARMTQGEKWHLLGFIALTVLINLVGVLVFFVGVLVTIPITLLAYADIYLKLKSPNS